MSIYIYIYNNVHEMHLNRTFFVHSTQLCTCITWSSIKMYVLHTVPNYLKLIKSRNKIASKTHFLK